MSQVVKKVVKKGKSQKKHVSKSDTARIEIPVGRVTTALRRDMGGKRVGKMAGSYVAGLLQYVTTFVLNAASLELEAKKSRIFPRHILRGIQKDAYLKKLLGEATIAKGGVLNYVDTEIFHKKTQVAQRKANDKTNINLGEASTGKSSSKKSKKSTAKKSSTKKSSTKGKSKTKTKPKPKPKPGKKKTKNTKEKAEKPSDSGLNNDDDDDDDSDYNPNDSTSETESDSGTENE